MIPYRDPACLNKSKTMKKILLALTLMGCLFQTRAQVKLDDFGRIVLNTFVSPQLKIPEEARKSLETKLSQIATLNGMGGSAANPRFIITAAVNVGTKDIVPGPPQLVAQNLEVTLFTGDAEADIRFSNLVLNVKGVGTNENKAFIDAFKNINPRNKDIAAFLEEGKNKIVSYYAAQCDIILKQADALAAQYKYDEALYKLMTIPETCQECYARSRDGASAIFNRKIESDCTEKVKQARLLWAAESNEAGAAKAVEVLTGIIPSEGCKAEIGKISAEISRKLQDDQRKKYEFDMLEMQKKYDTEQKRLDAEKQIALEQAKNQPVQITYNHIVWW